MTGAPTWIRGGIVALLLLGPARADSAWGGSFGATGLAPMRALASSVEQSSAGAPSEGGPIEPPPAIDAPAEPDADRDPFPGRTYGNYGKRRCLDELDARDVPYERRGYARGVDAPVRLMGELHGVRFLHADAVDWMWSAKREVLDCRLVLALDDLARVLARHGVREVLHFGIYRGDVPLPQHGRPLHHVAGLAIDVAAFVKEDGERLEVRRDWAGRPGARTCGDLPERAHASDASIELRRILCDVVDEKVFHQVLTPNHDRRHRDHFHLEVMRDTSWTLVQ